MFFRPLTFVLFLYFHFIRYCLSNQNETDIRLLTEHHQTFLKFEDRAEEYYQVVVLTVHLLSMSLEYICVLSVSLCSCIPGNFKQRHIRNRRRNRSARL
jgi:hypothetical protein